MFSKKTGPWTVGLFAAAIFDPNWRKAIAFGRYLNS
jgi:hypothetical protein